MGCSENQKRKTSGPVSSNAKDATCRTIHFKKYVLMSHYMTKDLIIVSNIINMYHNWINISTILKDLIMNDPEDVKEKMERTQEKPITDKKKWNKYIPGHVGERAHREQLVFVQDLVNVFKQLFTKANFEYDDDDDNSNTEEITLFVLAVQNKHLKGRDLQPSLLKCINPGLGVIWIKPEVVKTEPMIVCRPRSYGNLFKMHKTPENHSDNYVVALDTIPFRNTAIGGSIFVPNAFVREWKFYSKVIVINPSNKSQTDEEFEILKDPKNKRNEGWWPVICPPSLDARMFATANSPVGRLATHFEDKINLQNNFNNPEVKDIKFVKVFTLNPVFSDVFSNINTLVLYPRDVIENPCCPLNKYLTFNELAAQNANAMINNTTRIGNLKGPNPDFETHDAAGENINHYHDYEVSRLIGSAFPKTCWSDRKLQNGNPPEEKSVDVKEDGSFIIYGVDSFSI